MLVLGFNGGPKSAEEDDAQFDYQHDAAAVLLHNGELVCAIEEERLNRIKHTNCFPARAIDFCLNKTSKSWRDLDSIVYVADENRLRMSVQRSALEDTVVCVPPSAESFVASIFEQEFATDVRSKLSFCDHHDAHVWSAFACSGFEEALVVSVDGEGDGRAGVVCACLNNTMLELRDYPTVVSLGNFYTAMIRLLGYTRFDEYKVMGLAPYGDPAVFESTFHQGYSLLPKGHYVLDPIPRWISRFQALGILEQARRKGGAFSKLHLDLAAGLQDMLERIVIHLLSYFRRETRIRNLCLAGGVAHNCTSNGKILRSGLFDKVFVQPASHDAGGALGAACWITCRKTGGAKIDRMRHVYLGSDIGTSEGIASTLARWDNFLRFDCCSDTVAKIARIIADGAVVGWVQGRSEFGPRALGNRSILADPRPAANKDLINEMVKKREQFRPFAPSVVEERVTEFFEVPECEADLSHMTYALSVRESMRNALGAVTHVDGTARLQTVSRSVNPRFWELLTEFGNLTGFPVLLNTSFNNDVEPIVDSVEDAIVCFLTTGITVLVVGDYIVSKHLPAPDDPAWLDLVPTLPSSRRLIKCKIKSETVYLIESTKGTRYRKMSLAISATVYSLLSLCNDQSNVGELLCERLVHDNRMVPGLIDEILILWSRRMIDLRPPIQAGTTRHVCASR
jgi:carbamoyltransferase